MSDTLDGGMWALGGAIAGKAIDALVLSWCTTGALDYAHSTPGVWGAAGVVWRTGGD